MTGDPNIKHIPQPGEWTFKSPEVAEGFDAHVRQQLPWYDMVTNAIVQIGRHYVGDRGLVYDIGSSTGNIARALGPVVIERRAELVAIEESVEMCRQWQGPGVLVHARAQDYDFENYDLAVAMLALMFNRPDEVAPLVGTLVEKIRPGGALIMVERMLPPDGYLSIVSSRLTLEAKQRAGSAPEEIIAKELSLAGVQRPLDRRLLEYHGAVEWFRYGDFAGWVIESKAVPWHRRLPENLRDGVAPPLHHPDCPVVLGTGFCTCSGAWL